MRRYPLLKHARLNVLQVGVLSAIALCLTAATVPVARWISKDRDSWLYSPSHLEAEVYLGLRNEQRDPLHGYYFISLGAGRMELTTGRYCDVYLIDRKTNPPIDPVKTEDGKLILTGPVPSWSLIADFPAVREREIDGLNEYARGWPSLFWIERSLYRGAPNWSIASAKTSIPVTPVNVARIAPSWTRSQYVHLPGIAKSCLAWFAMAYAAFIPCRAATSLLVRSHKPGLCPNCRYPIAGLPICPECGTASPLTAPPATTTPDPTSTLSSPPASL